MQPLHTIFQVTDRCRASGTPLSSRSVGPVVAIAAATVANIDALRRRGEEDGGLSGEVYSTVEKVVPATPQLRPPR